MGFWWLDEKAAREFLSNPDTDSFDAEDLHPDLLACLTNDDNLYHPLCEQQPYCDPVGANKQYEWKLKDCCEWRVDRDWSKMFMHIEKRWKLEIFEMISNEFDDAEYWRRLGGHYTAAEFFYNKQDLVRRLLTSTRVGRENLMTQEERDLLSALPDVVTVYRGYAFDNATGWSWTLDENRAIWFANRPSGNPNRTPRLCVGQVEKKNVIAHFKGRKESEVLVDPAHVTNVKTKVIVNIK